MGTSKSYLVVVAGEYFEGNFSNLRLLFLSLHSSKQDPEADRAHGKALGEYWAQKGKAIGEYWAQKGPELHTYYEDKYRTMFDPTYVKPQEQP